MESSPLKKILIFIGILILILFALLYYGLGYIFSINEQNAILSRNLKAQTKKLSYIQSAEASSVDSNKSIAEIKKTIVATDGDVAFIEGVESMAKNAHVEIKIDSLSLQNSPELDKIGLTILKVRFETKGSWESAYRFGQGLESLPFSVKINTFDLVQSGNTSSLDPKVEKGFGSWQSLFEIDVLKFK